MGTFSIIGRMITPRRGHIAILLQNGKVLIAGGKDDKGLTLATAEVYDPVENKFYVTGQMFAARLTEHTPNAISLPNGHIMIAGGYGGVRGELASVELYDPSKGIFTDGGNMAIHRACHTLTLLSNGKILIVGGVNEASKHLKSAELYDPTTKSSILIPEAKVPHFHHTATLLPNGKVLIVGGYSNEIELFNPATNTFSSSGILRESRYLHTTVLLDDGRVAIIGGASGSRSLASVEFLQV
jgi:WD40 repeat protein